MKRLYGRRSEGETKEAGEEGKQFHSSGSGGGGVPGVKEEVQ